MNTTGTCWSGERGENISWDNNSSAGISMSLGLRSAPEFSRRLDWGWEAVNNPFMFPHHEKQQCEAEAEAEEGSQAASFRKYNESLMGLSSHQEKTLGMLGGMGIRSFGGFPSSSGFHGGLLYTDMPGLGFGVGGYDSGSPWVGMREQHGHKEGTVFSVKREERCADELQAARIGLNLGHRTYFSEADAAAAAAATVSGLYKRPPRAMGAASKTPPRCQAEGCKADLSNAKHYHRRHKVCEFHSKATSVLTSGVQQRFCQQCSRFHGLLEFDETKRSCRKRLADHNRRRRKPPQANAAGAAAPLEAEMPTPTPALLKAFNIKS